jgi:signal transduction histidine kinase
LTDEPQDRGRTPPAAGVDLVRRVSQRILRGLVQRTGRPGAESPQLLQDLERYRSCVEAVLEGDPPDAVAVALPGSAGPLADLFQRRLLEIEEPERARHVLDALRAVAALRREAGASRSRDPDPELKAWLTRPGAFELLVEVAHDLRSPLTSILFLSEAIRAGQSGDLNDVQRSQMGLIYSAALGLVSVTSNVMELAKDEKAIVTEDEATAFSVAEVIQGVVQMVRPMAEEKGIELRVVNADRERSHGHPAALSRILLNLATNGLKFTEDGYVEIGVTRVGQHTLCYHVEDSGRGIPEPQLAQLFQPFRRRLRDDSHFFSGSGLGLSICQRLLNAMGSELEVETELERGTRFHFTLTATPER